MRIDVSDERFDRRRDFTRVLLQQGRPILDRDWNEHTSIVLDQIRALGRAFYGRHGGPPGESCGFVPYVKGGQLRIRKGQYVVDGLPLDCDREYTLSEQKYCTSKPLEDGPAQLIYLEVFEREVVGAEDVSLLDAALPNVDLAARGQVVWRVKSCKLSSLEGPPSDSFPKNAVAEANKWAADRRATPSLPEYLDLAGSQELANAVDGKSSQLVRLEFHGKLTDRPGTMWKFSADNGFPLFKIDNTSEGRKTGLRNILKINLANLASFQPTVSEFVEALTLEQLYFGEPGQLLRVEKVTEDNSPNLAAANSIDLHFKNDVDPKCEYVRVWNSTFCLDSVPNLSPGDYWQSAVRESKPDLKHMKLKRPPRHFVPLALVGVGSGGSKIEILARFQRVVGLPWRELDETIDGASQA